MSFKEQLLNSGRLSALEVDAMMKLEPHPFLKHIMHMLYVSFIFYLIMDSSEAVAKLMS